MLMALNVVREEFWRPIRIATGRLHRTKRKALHQRPVASRGQSNAERDEGDLVQGRRSRHNHVSARKTK